MNPLGSKGMANFQGLLLFGMVKLSRSLQQSGSKCSTIEDEKLFEIVYEVSMPFSMIYDRTP